jgi:hypothetical protein
MHSLTAPLATTTRFPLRRSIACLLLCASVPSCAGVFDPTGYIAPGVQQWGVVEGTPEEVVTQLRPEELRVTLLDGERFVVRGPVVVRDTLAGLGLRGATPTSVAIPVDSVAVMELLPASEKARRVALPIMLGVAVLGLIALGALSTMWGS